MIATTGISGSSSQNTHLQPSRSVIVPAIAGAIRLGNTHPADRYAYMRRLTVFGEGPLDEHVGDGRQAPGARALQSAPDHDELHALRGRRDHQTGGEDREAGEVRPGGSEAIGQLARDDERDQVGQRVAGQRDAVQRVAVQLDR